MAFVTWVGGTHSLTNPAAWTPAPPASGDSAEIDQGTGVAVGTTLDSYRLSVDSPTPASSSIDLLQSTLGANFVLSCDNTFYEDATFPEPDYATFSFLGRDVSAGTVYTGEFYTGGEDPHPVGNVTINIADVASRSDPSIAVQAGRLTNTGQISAAINSVIRINAVSSTGGPSRYGLFVNNSFVYSFGTVIVDAPVTGSGGFFASGEDYGNTGQDTVILDQYVASTQTVDFGLNGTVRINDPHDFFALITDIEVPQIFSFWVNLVDVAGAATRGNFDGSTLTLFNGDAVVAHLRFTDVYFGVPFVAGNFAVSSSGGRTHVSFNAAGTGGALPVSSGPGPTFVDPGPPILTPPTLLATSATDLTLASGTRTLTQARIEGYAVRLEGTDPSASTPAVSMTFGTIGAHASLVVGDLLVTPHFGVLNAVGFNDNDGLIAAEGGAAAVPSRLTFAIENIPSPEHAGDANPPVVQPGVFVNLGTIAALDSGCIQIDGDAGSKLINSGTIASSGIVFLGTSITGSGTISVGTASGTVGSLEVQRDISTSQSVLLQAGTLTIDNAQSFFATVFDFGPHDLIVLKGVDVGGVAYNNGALLLDGGADGTLHFHRPNGVTFDTASFVLQHTGTDTTITTTV